MDMLAELSENAVSHCFDNGFTLAMERLPYLHSASVGIWIKTGSANEDPAVAGVAHFLEHLLFKGTDKRTPHEIMEEIEGKGGHLNAFTSRGYTCLYAKVLGKDVGTAIDVLSDLIKNSVFADLDKERGVVLEEIAAIEDTPDELIHDLFGEHHWPNHPLGRPVIGYSKTVQDLDLDKVRDFYATWYQPQNMVLSIAGNFDEDAVLAQVRDEFECVASTLIPDECGAPEFKTGGAKVDRDIAQAHINLAFPGPPLGDEERYVCDMTSCILGGGSTSRLFERIREDEGLAYSIYTFHSFYPMAGIVGGYAGVAPQNCAHTFELIFEEIRKLRDEGVPEVELNSNREQIKGNMLMAMENTFSRMSRLAKCHLYYGRIIPVQEVIDHIDAVTVDRVKAFSEKTFRADQCSIMVLGPDAAQVPETVAL